jgi:hypothetical protein
LYFLFNTSANNNDPAGLLTPKYKRPPKMEDGDVIDEPARTIGLTCLTSGRTLSQLLKMGWKSPIPHNPSSST